MDTTKRVAQTLTHSRLACFRACPRKHYLRYEVGLRREETSQPLRVGSGFHAALDAQSKGLDVETVIDAEMEDPYEKALVAAMFLTHHEQWQGQDLEVVASELPFDLPIVNPETGAPTPIWRKQGVIDRIVKLPDGRLALMENKTTTRDFGPGEDYWVRLHLDPQLSIYVIAAREMGYEVETVLYDVMRRPLHRPKLATPLEKRKFKKRTKAQVEDELPEDDLTLLYANQRLEDEAPEDFAARLGETIREDPHRYFARIEIARLEQDLEDCRHEMWQQQKAVREAQKMERWYRNPGACFEPFRCDYLDVCQNRDLETWTPDGFARVEDRHPELSVHATDGG